MFRLGPKVWSLPVSAVRHIRAVMSRRPLPRLLKSHAQQKPPRSQAENSIPQTTKGTGPGLALEGGQKGPGRTPVLAPSQEHTMSHGPVSHYTRCPPTVTLALRPTSMVRRAWPLLRSRLPTLLHRTTARRAVGPVLRPMQVAVGLLKTPPTKESATCRAAVHIGIFWGVVLFAQQLIRMSKLLISDL